MKPNGPENMALSGPFGFGKLLVDLGIVLNFLSL